MDNNDLSPDQLQELEELRRQWRALGERIAHLEGEMPPPEPPRGDNHRRRLMRQSIIVAVVAFVSILWCFPLAFNLIFPLWLSWLIGIYFIIMGTLNFLFYQRLRNFDIAAVDSLHALHEVVAIIEMRRRFQIVGISLMVPLLCCMLFIMAGNSRAVFIGGIAGAIVGALIGFFMDRSARRHLREMKRQFADPSV